MLKGNPIRLKNGQIISMSQALEWSKFIPSSPLVDNLQMFIPL
jgi:hypothetical protein